MSEVIVSATKSDNAANEGAVIISCRNERELREHVRLAKALGNLAGRNVTTVWTRRIVSQWSNLDFTFRTRLVFTRRKVEGPLPESMYP